MILPIKEKWLWHVQNWNYDYEIYCTLMNDAFI
jgi:hypothetical protein